MDCTESQHLLTAYIDDELDVTNAVLLEQHLADCGGCRYARDAVQQLRVAIKTHAVHHAAPAYLRARIQASTRAESDGNKVAAKRSWTWLNLGTALASVMAFAFAITLYWAVPSKVDQISSEIVASHARSLMADHLADVASSDRHTVKPWFTGKLDFAPTVVDLTAQGFILVGGRLDYVNGRAVAVSVYRRGQHVINVFMWPVSYDNTIESQQLSKQGYHLVSWADTGMVFWAVSDLNFAELTQLKGLLK